jgi:hypothetical protein
MSSDTNLHVVAIAHGNSRAELIENLEKIIKEIRAGICNAIQGDAFEFDVYKGEYFYAADMYKQTFLHKQELCWDIREF